MASSMGVNRTLVLRRVCYKRAKFCELTALVSEGHSDGTVGGTCAGSSRSGGTNAVIRVYDEASNVNGDEEAARDEIADHHGIPYLCDVFGGVKASFWKRGSFRSGSNMGSSRSSAGVSGTSSRSGPAYGIESSFCKAAMARSGSPIC